MSQAGTANVAAVSKILSFDVVAKQAQAITFDALADVTYGVADLTLSATASSALPVAFALISGDATLTGNVLSVNGIGDITIEARQSGDADFVIAAPAQQSFTVAKAPLQVTADDKTIVYGSTIPDLTYTFTGFVNGDTESDIQSTIALNTNATTSSDAGSYPIIASITAGATADNYSFTSADGALTIEKASQVITIQPIDDKIVNDPAFDVTATVDSNLDLIYTLTGPATLAGNTITLSGTLGTVTVTVSQTGTVNYAAVDATATFEVKPVLSAEDFNDHIDIYPNPTTSHIYVKSAEQVSLQFYTLSGALVKTVSKVNGAVDLKDLPSGVYMLQVATKDLVIYKSIIKSH